MPLSGNADGTAEQVEQFKKDGWDEILREKTGLIPDAYFSATKLAWILDHVPEARRKAEEGDLRVWYGRYLASVESDTG